MTSIDALRRTGAPFRPRTLVILLLFTCIAGCDRRDPESVLSDYLERVARILDQQISNGDPYQDLRPLPPRRDRILQVTELRAGLLESTGFSSCNLLPLIAERNSSLGKVMKPSTLLSYELRFFDRLDPCYQRFRRQTSTDQNFFRLLEETWRGKSANLESVVWNGLFTSEATERNFSLSRQPVPLTGNPGYGDSIRALQAFQAIVDRLAEYRRSGSFRLPPHLTAIEQHYAALHNSEYGSQLTKSLALLGYYLDLTATVLEQSLAQRPLCFNHKASEKALFLQNVFVKYYAADVQPYMAMVQRQGQEWLKASGALLDNKHLPVPDAMQRYRDQMLAMDEPDAPWSRYQQALLRHTRAWQQLLEQCGLMPGL